PTTTPLPFQSSQTYTYSVMIGHSIKTASTNSDINVTLQSLTVNGTGGETVLIVYFYDGDTKEGTNFEFHTLAHVSLIDNAGKMYQGINAMPSQLELQPQQEGAVQITFPRLPLTARWFDLYFNTDHKALDIPCVQMLPSGVTASC